MRQAPNEKCSTKNGGSVFFKNVNIIKDQKKKKGKEEYRQWIGFFLWLVWYFVSFCLGFLFCFEFDKFCDCIWKSLHTVRGRPSSEKNIKNM